MMKLSLFQGILLGFFALAAVVGVFVFATYQNSGGSGADVGHVTIWGTLPKDQIDQVLVTAGQTNQAFNDVIYSQKTLATFDTDLISAIAEGRAPDLILIPQEYLLPLSKILSVIPSASVSQRAFKDTFAAGGELYLSPTQGGSYGIPLLVDPLVLFTNRSILASNGIATVPATWEAVTGLVPKVAVKSPTGAISRSLIALGTYANVRNARGILSTLFLQAGVPMTTISTNGYRRADLGTSYQEGTPPGPAVARFYTQFADPSKVSYTWNTSLPDSQQAFLLGDLALYLGYASEATYLKDANPNLDFDIAPVPQIATGSTKTTYGIIYSLAVPKSSPNPTGATIVAAALSGLANDGLAASVTHMAPADRDLLAAPPSDPIAAVAYSSALYAKGWLSPTPRDTDIVFSAMINNVISGRLTLEAALTTAENALSVLIQQ